MGIPPCDTHLCISISIQLVMKGIASITLLPRLEKPGILIMTKVQNSDGGDSKHKNIDIKPKSLYDQ